MNFHHRFFFSLVGDVFSGTYTGPIKYAKVVEITFCLQQLAFTQGLLGREHRALLDQSESRLFPAHVNHMADMDLLVLDNFVGYIDLVRIIGMTRNHGLDLRIEKSAVQIFRCDVIAIVRHPAR